MSFIELLPTLLSIASTAVIALVGWGFRSTLSEIKSSIVKNTADIDKMDKRLTAKDEKLEGALNDLKADLPMIYVLREDFVRTMNGMERKIMGMDGKLDRVLETIAKGVNKDG